MFGRSDGLDIDQLNVERHPDTAGDLVLQRKQVARVAVEAPGQHMRAGLGIDQVRVDADLVARPSNASFQHVAHTKLAPDLLHIDAVALVREARIAGDYEQPADARQRGDDFLDHAVGEIFLVRIAAHILERQYRDRRLLRQRQGCRGGYGRCRRGCQLCALDTHRPGDILQSLLAAIAKFGLDLAPHLAERVLRDADPAGFGDTFKAGGEIYAVADDIVAFDQYVADVEPTRHSIRRSL